MAKKNSHRAHGLCREEIVGKLVTAVDIECDVCGERNPGITVGAVSESVSVCWNCCWEVSDIVIGRDNAEYEKDSSDE